MARIDNSLSAFERVGAEMGRAMTITTIPYTQAKALTEAANQGSRRASKILDAVGNLFLKIERADPPTQCLICNAQVLVPRGITVVFAGPDIDDASASAVAVVCPTCGGSPDVDARIITTFEAILGVPLSPVDVHLAAGRA
jgi:hypothetical protein